MSTTAGFELTWSLELLTHPRDSRDSKPSAIISCLPGCALSRSCTRSRARTQTWALSYRMLHSKWHLQSLCQTLIGTSGTSIMAQRVKPLLAMSASHVWDQQLPSPQTPSHSNLYLILKVTQYLVNINCAIDYTQVIILSKILLNINIIPKTKIFTDNLLREQTSYNSV